MSLARRTLALILFLVGIGIALLPPIQQLENRCLDLLFRLRGPIQPKARVVVVAVDDVTERRWANLPKAFWGGQIAQVLAEIGKSPTKSVGIDFVFSVDSDDFLQRMGSSKTPNLDLDNAVHDIARIVILGSKTGNDVVLPLSDTTDGRRLASLNATQSEAGVIHSLPRIDRTITPPMRGMAAALAGSAGNGEKPIQINYGGAPIQVVSVGDVLDHKVKASAFDGATIILGETYLASQDRSDTPFASAVPGVFIQAEATQTLLDHRELVGLPGWLTCAISAAVSLIALFLATKVRVLSFFLGAFCLAGAWTALSFAAFAKFLFVLPLASPLIVGLLIVPVVLYPVMALEERRERLWARSAWGQMISEPFVRIMESHRNLGLGAFQTFEAALMFVDVAGFSETVNRIPADEVVEGLNQVLEIVVREVEAREGVVLNFVGDGVFAMFSAKDRSRKDCLNQAMGASRQVLRHLREAPGSWRARIGLAFGEVSLALVGTKNRKQLTVYGKAVNMASRLEQAGKRLNPDSDVVPIASDLVASGDYAEAIAESGGGFGQISYTPKGWAEPLAVFYLEDP